jgi:hypothetical protein
MKDVGLLYRGGSGGQFMLHFLLLSKKYFTKFHFHSTMFNNGNFHSMFKIINKSQFSEKCKSEWKHVEEWPDNQQTSEYNGELNKLYLGCNWEDDTWKFPDVRTVLLYLDLETQLLMAHYKNATPYWGEDKEVHVQKTIEEFQNCEEYNSKHVFGKMLYSTVKNESCKGFNELAEQADVLVNLRDLISNPQEVLFSIDKELILNQNQEEFLERWKNLHSLSLQKTLNLW